MAECYSVVSGGDRETIRVSKGGVGKREVEMFAHTLTVRVWAGAMLADSASCNAGLSRMASWGRDGLQSQSSMGKAGYPLATA